MFMTHDRKLLRAATLVCATAFALAATGGVAANRCNEEVLGQLMAWCVDDSHEFSNYQKSGRDEIILGRYCKKPGLVADGFLICQGHDPQAIVLGYECWRDSHMKAAVAALKEDDPRKPEKCSN
jgi:hypothetical protein